MQLKYLSARRALHVQPPNVFRQLQHLSQRRAHVLSQRQYPRVEILICGLQFWRFPHLALARLWRR